MVRSIRRRAVAAVAACVAVTALVGCIPRATGETLTLGAEPVTTQYCYRDFDLVRIALVLMRANVEDDGTPVVHASFSTGQQYDMALSGESSGIYEPDLLQANGCIQITWSALRSPADGPLVVTIANNGYF